MVRDPLALLEVRFGRLLPRAIETKAPVSAAHFVGPARRRRLRDPTRRGTSAQDQLAEDEKLPARMHEEAAPCRL
jgi:hypothetical protein